MNQVEIKMRNVDVYHMILICRNEKDAKYCHMLAKEIYGDMCSDIEQMTCSKSWCFRVCSDDGARMSNISKQDWNNFANQTRLRGVLMFPWRGSFTFKHLTNLN